MPSVITAEELRAVLGVGQNVTDPTLEQIAEAAEQAILAYLRTQDSNGDPIDYSEIAVVKECVLAAAVELWKTRSAPGGGAYSSVDFTPSPFALGRSFFDRFEGPMAPYISTAGWLM